MSTIRRIYTSFIRLRRVYSAIYSRNEVTRFDDRNKSDEPLGDNINGRKWNWINYRNLATPGIVEESLLLLFSKLLIRIDEDCRVTFLLLKLLPNVNFRAMRCST